MRCRLADIFKYLDLKERVRYERVEKRWRDSINQFWNRQFAVCIATKKKRLSNHKFFVLNKLKSCSDVTHHLRECDIVKIKSKKKVHRYCYGILRRCRNLRALTLIGPVPEDLSSYLFTHCPHLEHIVSANSIDQ